MSMSPEDALAARLARAAARPRRVRPPDPTGQPQDLMVRPAAMPVKGEGGDVIGELRILADGYVTHPDGTISQRPDPRLPGALPVPRIGQGQVTMSLAVPSGLLAVPGARVAVGRRLGPRGWGRVLNTAGLSAAHANALLEIYRATSFTAITLYVKLHTGDPGASAANNASAVTTRNAASFAAAASGSMSLSTALTAYNMTATETLTHISCWDASSGGNFIRSAALSSSKSVVNLDTFTLSTLTFSYVPLAA